jgi:hypothetical protein
LKNTTSARIKHAQRDYALGFTLQVVFAVENWRYDVQISPNDLWNSRVIHWTDYHAQKLPAIEALLQKIKCL